MGYGFQQAFMESISNVTATRSVELGAIRFHDGEYYEYVHAAKELPQGYGAVKTGTSGKTCIATGSVSGELCAGFVKHATIASGSYGWLLVKGVVDAKNGRAGTAPVINQVARLGADGAFVTDLMVLTSGIDNGPVVGKILSAGASGDTGASLSLLLVSLF